MLQPVHDDAVRSHVRLLFVGAGVLLLVNILIGFLNIVSDPVLPRGQLLAHFHAGTIGWVTLSVIATMLWLFTGQRTVDDAYVRFTGGLAWVGIIAVAGYILGFYLAFNGAGPFWLLPLFGIPAALVIVGAFLFSWMHLGSQRVVTTPHLLLFGALIVATLGSLMGVLRGLDYNTAATLYPGGADPVGAHAGPMDMYLALAFAGIVETFLAKDPERRWTRPGMSQMVLGVVAAFLAWASLFFGIGPLAPLALLLFLATFLFYLGRVGWRTFTCNPFSSARNAGLFWGGLAFPAYIGLFVYLVFTYFIPGDSPPHALVVTFVHVTFIGLATNLLFATQLQYAPAASSPDKLALTGVWVTNLGMLAFFAGEFAALRRDGAGLMGLGIILGLIAIWRRFAVDAKRA